MESPTDRYQRPTVPPGKFRFYSTGSPDIFLKGIEIELDMTYNPQQCKEYLKSILKDKIPNIDNFDLLVYLSGGIPFLGGTLGDIYPIEKETYVKPYIYGILTRPISDKKLVCIYPELCNVSNKTHRLLLSPICNSTENGLIDISCILGYLNHDGVLGDKFLKCCASVTHFPPLITSLNRIIERNGVTGRDVITVTSSLHTFFTSLVTPTPSPAEVFNHAIKCCNYIINIMNDNDSFPMKCFELKDSDPSVQFLVKLNQPKMVYFWEGDKESEYVYCNLRPFDPNEETEEYFLSFKPIAPLSIRVATGCSIVKGKDHNYLYLMQSALKDQDYKGNVDIINPVVGYADSVGVEDFATLQENTEMSDAVNLIDPDRVQQVIFVCFDMSDSMSWTLDGRRTRDRPNMNSELRRSTVAIQYLTSFANKTYGYKIPCIQGLIRFNNKIELSAQLSPLVPDFENKGLTNLDPKFKTFLWDALSFACDEMVKFTFTQKGFKKFKNAVNRILVISDGEDQGSTTPFIDVVKKLVAHKIIVDSVIVSGTEKCQRLCTLSHITGGLAFYPKNTNDGLHLFEKSAFLNYSERYQTNVAVIPGDSKSKPNRLTPDSITEDFISRALKACTFDTDIQNKTYMRAINENRLTTPSSICSRNMNMKIKEPRRRRILRELQYAAMVMDPSLKKNDDDPDKDKQVYDDTIVVHPFNSCLDIWQVFLKGTDCTPYYGKWFHLIVTFPELYPLEPPVFRFVQVPYHMNISSEGRICLNVLDKGYLPSRHVIDIITMLKELFVIPCLETAVQLDIRETFVLEREKYDELARESALRVGKDDYKEFFSKSTIIEDKVENGFKPIFDKDNKPDYMISQFSGRAIRDPVRAPNGIYYEKQEYVQLLTTYRNPICMIRGKDIKDVASNYANVAGRDGGGDDDDDDDFNI